MEQPNTPASRHRRNSKAVLLATVLLAPIALLTACGEDDAPPPDAFRFSDPAACLQLYDEATCRESQRMAQVNHEATAPRFSARAGCEGEYGQCYQTSSGFWMPFMSGFLIARMASGGWVAQPGLPLRRDGNVDCRFAPDQRACERAQGRTGGGVVFVNNSHLAYGRSSVIPAPAPTSPRFTSPSFNTPAMPASPRAVGTTGVARGVFGSTASAVGSGGTG